MLDRSSQRKFFDSELQDNESMSGIIVSVDFGTTYSGIAYAYTSSPEDQYSITTWPDASGALEGKTRDKVPTVLRYVNGNAKWGSQFSAIEEHHKWFKLALDNQQDRKLNGIAAAFIDPSAKAFAEKVPPQKKVTDFLTGLRKHAELVLRNKIAASVLNNTPIQYILTIPAIWSEAAQAKTRACAQSAGMGLGASLHLVSEPEAAAIFALKTMKNTSWNVGEQLLLVDAGGGTVDLISYRITQIRPIIKIIEATPGTGNFCGSSYIDRLFQKKLFEKLGTDTNWNREVLDEAITYFRDEVKPVFIDNGEEFKIPVSGIQDNARKGVRRCKMTLTSEEIKTIFDPVINEVILLILDQVRAVKAAKGSLSKILLVGGFGQSSYLREKVRDAVKGVEVLQPENGSLAVARGALMRGLEAVNASFSTVNVHGRVARKHYGPAVDTDFDPEEHEARLKFWNDADGVFRVPIISWFARRGDIIENEKPFRLHYFQNHEKDLGKPGKIFVNIKMCSKGHVPPVHETLDVHQLVRLEADLTRVPVSRFPVFLGDDGLEYYRIRFQVQVTYHSAFTSYELIQDGVNYGEIQAEYV